MIGMSIINIGFFGLQHQKLLDDVRTDNIQNVNQTRVIIVNVTGETSNITKAILKNMTLQIESQNELINSKVDRAMGVAVRAHNDVQQILHILLNMTNSIGRSIDILPAFR